MIDPKLAAALKAFARQSSGRVEIAGRSMRPLLRAGMIADVEALDRAPKIGDLLVFRSPAGLTAHRVIENRGAFGYITCGDAMPESPEWVRMADVMGRVRAIWASAAPNARRIDGALFRAAGLAMIKTRRARATLRLAARAIPLAWKRPNSAPAFRALLGASVAFERADFEVGLSRLRAVPLESMTEIARRHGMSLMLEGWLRSASERGLSDARPLLSTFNSGERIPTVEIVSEAFRVSALLSGSRIEHAVLGEAARLSLGGRPDTEGSNQIVLFVPSDRADAAVALLRAEGFDERIPTDILAPVERGRNGRAPLRSESSRVAVRIRERVDLAGRACLAETSAGTIRVVDRAADAFAAADAARGFETLRDIVSLGRDLAGLSPADRVAFDLLVASRNPADVRLQAAIATADCLLGERSLPHRVASYLSWVAAREDLPRILRNRAALLDTIKARNFGDWSSLRVHSFGEMAAYVADVVAMPVLVRWVRWSTKTFGNGSDVLGGRPGARTRDSALPMTAHRKVDGDAHA